MNVLMLFAAEGNVAASQMGWNLTGLGLFAFVAGLVVFRYTTRAGVIAAATTKEAIRQPLFLMTLALASLVLIINTVLPFFSLGEDVKMLKDCGMATILISGLLLAVWTASMSIAEEIEGKTAMTLLSKPINRQQFILGKYVGILQAVLLLVGMLSFMLLFLIYYKVGYDARESGGTVPQFLSSITVSWLPFKLPALEPQRYLEAVQVIPGLILIAMEVAVLTAVSVAISTRLPMVVNMTTCFAIFVIGHLTPVLVQVEPTVRSLEVVQFVAQLIATVLPALEVFNMTAAVATGTTVPPQYIGWAAIYGFAYVGAAVLLAFIMFEDRDLA
ncbi:ABC transporter permease [Calycomorphotria hydatis]|uniref:ABC-2 family transporter protein n=1 Tax=Calycomorphotria hydatis TaxID=2528027 RepID=A0A517TD41_9PLAN|nr:ABC transporter permease [Calycomorphotria hydatis]QDT66293.1 hypothetical protein V22_35580 [Calycomorphotria hydatis]